MSVGGTPSIGGIASILGQTAPHSMSELYNVQFTDGTYSPSTGTISLSHFRNKTIGAPPPPAPGPGDSCFAPTTLLRMLDGTLRTMEDILIGDVLHGGITVNAVVRILNIHHTPYYKIHNSELSEPIYVTGTHRVKEDDGTIVKVSEYSKAEFTDLASRMWVCLITDNHMIPIGEHTFWDWADMCDACEKSTI